MRLDVFVTLVWERSSASPAETEAVAATLASGLCPATSSTSPASSAAARRRSCRRGARARRDGQRDQPDLHDGHLYDGSDEPSRTSTSPAASRRREPPGGISRRTSTMRAASWRGRASARSAAPTRGTVGSAHVLRRTGQSLSSGPGGSCSPREPGDGDARVRHRDTRRDGGARAGRRGARRAALAGCRVLADADELLRDANARPADLTGSPSASAPGASPACASASRPRAGSRSRSTFRSPASRRSTRSPPARRARCR